MGILRIYKDYRQYIPQFYAWNEQQKTIDAQKINSFKKFPNTPEEKKLTEEKTKIISQALINLDNYAQTQAEDVEAVAQTTQWEAILLLGSLGIGIQKLLKHVFSKMKSPKNTLLKATTKALPSVVGAIAPCIMYIPIAAKLIKLQIDATRMARFNFMHFDWDKETNFAILTEDQKLEAKKRAKDIQLQPEEVKPLINTVNIFSTIKNVNKLMKQKKQYQIDKFEFDKSMSDKKENLISHLTEKDKLNAEKEKEFFAQVIKKIDIDSHDRLERTEKITNVFYSSLFIGGFLENLIMDKLVNLIKIKNKFIKFIAKIGIPVASVLLLSNILSTFQNTAIKAVRFKNIKNLEKNPEELEFQDEKNIEKSIPQKEKVQEKQNIFKFLKELFNDINTYQKYMENDYKEERKLEKAIKTIELTPKQKKDAEIFRENAVMSVNMLDDKTQKYSESIEILSEVFSTPINIFSTAAGAMLGKVISKSFKKISKFEKLAMGIGSLIAFLPIMAFEIYSTGEQRKALRVASMLAIKDLDKPNRYIDYNVINKEKSLYFKNDLTEEK